MIKLKHLLLENPDTVWYNQKSYSYTTRHNRSAFLVYDDLINKRENYFGYDRDTGKFYSNDADLVREVEKLENASADSVDEPIRWVKSTIKHICDSGNGSSHNDVWDILKDMNRGSRREFPKNRGRFFEVPDDTKPGGTVCIMTFWYDQEMAVKYKDTWDKICGALNLNPKEILYNPGSRVMTYDEFYKTGKQDKPVSIGDSDTFKFKVDDKIRLKGLPTVTGVITHVDSDHTHIDGINYTIEIKKSKYPSGLFRPERSIKLRSSEIELDTSHAPWEPVTASAASVKLDKVIDDKVEEYSEKRGKLHTTGATFTTVEKQNLENEVDSLEIEIKILYDLLNSGEKYYTHNVKSVVATSIQRKLHVKQKEKQDRYSLASQAEKQYGMPIAQIRAKYRNVPLDQLVKKESLYKKLLKSLNG